MKKYVKDGMVAVIVSPGFGAGWSTWGNSSLASDKLFSPELVQMILDEKDSYEIERKAEELFPDEYTGGLNKAVIEWVKEGTKFRIHEYDGKETLITLDKEQYFIA